VARWGLLAPFVAEARSDGDLRQELFDCVSGRTPYRDVVLRRANLRLAPRMAWKCALHLLRGRGRRAAVEPTADGHG
jgi:hypothetical protein